MHSLGPDIIGLGPALSVKSSPEDSGKQVGELLLKSIKIMSHARIYMRGTSFDVK